MLIVENPHILRGVWTMNIGIIISDICLNAGTERAVSNLSNALLELTDNMVYIFSVNSKEDKTIFYDVDPRIKIIHLNYPKNNYILKRLVIYNKIRKELTLLCQKYNIDVLMGTSHAYNCIISIMNNVVRIGCEHINYSACPKVYRLVRRVAYKRLDKVVLLTNEDMKKYSFLKKNIPVVIPNIRSFYPKCAAKLENKRIISIGRLNSQKGYDILMNFADCLYKKIPNWKIEIFGEGEMRDDLLTTIKNKGLEKFITIHSPKNNIMEELLESSIYLMTSRNEGLPMVLLEAQACGLPIVSYDCPEGPKDIISDGDDGFLIPMNADEQMIKRIEYLAESHKERIRMGKEARKHSNNFSKEFIVKKWILLFNELINKESR